MNNDDIMAVNETAGEEASTDNTPLPEEQAPEEEQQLEEEVATEPESQETETVEESPKSAASRIRELNSKAKAAIEENRSLKERLAELTNPVGFNPQSNNQQPSTPQEDELNPDGTVNADAFRNRVLAEAEARAELRIRQSEAINRIQRESDQAVTAWPQLDPNSSQYNKELSDAVTEATEAYVRSNPYSASVKTFVDKMMKPYQGAVAKEVGQASEKIAKQVSQAALRPTTVRQPEKTAAEKSIAELEQELGMVHS